MFTEKQNENYSTNNIVTFRLDGNVNCQKIHYIK